MVPVNLRKKLWKETLKASEKRIGKDAWRAVHWIHEEVSQWVHPAHVLFAFCDKKQRQKGLTTWRASKHSVLNERLPSESGESAELVSVLGDGGGVTSWIEAGY